MEKIQGRHQKLVKDFPRTDYVIGIDPGLKGGMALFDCHAERVLGVHVTPTISAAGERTAYDVRKMAYKLLGFFEVDTLEDKTFTICIEQQHPMPQQGVVSMFTTGLGFGLWLGLAHGMKDGRDYVQTFWARDWQKILWDEDAPDETKARSISRVHRLFPYVNLAPGKRRTDSDGLADAVNIAHYGYMRMM